MPVSSASPDAPPPRVLGQGSLPSDGTALSFPPPPAEGYVRLELRGEIIYAYTGEPLDGRSADMPGSLIQIEPGQWRVVQGDEASQTYLLEPEVQSLTPPTLRLDLRSLVERDVRAPGAVAQDLAAGGTLQASLLHTPPPPAPSFFSQLDPSRAGSTLVALVALVVWLRHRRKLARLTAPEDRLLREIQAAVTRLLAQKQRLAEISPDLEKGLLELRASAQTIHARATLLRRQLASTPLERLEAEIAATTDLGIRTQKQQAHALLLPLKTEADALRGLLEQMNASLESTGATLLRASLEADTLPPDAGRQALERLERDVRAGVEAQREIARISR